MTPDEGLVVTGSGTAAATPDVVRLSLAVEVTGEQVDAVLARATQAQSELRRSLLSSGVAERDLRSGRTALWSDQGQGGTGPARHTARLSTVATVREVDRAGAVMSGALAAAGDAARMDGMAFAHSDPSALAAQARAAAFADARATAEQLAAMAGRSLGDVVLLEEGAPSGPGPLRARAMAADAAVDPGELEVTAAVTVRWAWGGSAQG